VEALMEGDFLWKRSGGEVFLGRRKPTTNIILDNNIKPWFKT